MKIEILTNRSGYRQDIKEVRDEWIDEVLNYLGVDTEIFDEAGEDQSILLEYLMYHKIEILN